MARKKSRANSKVSKSESKNEMKDSLDTSQMEDSVLHRFFKTLVIVAALPLIAGFLSGLAGQINMFEPILFKSVYWGVASYILLHLFIFEPGIFYKNTQKFTQHLFGFLSPLFKVSYYIIPFWAIAVIGCYFPARAFFPGTGLSNVFYFLSSFVFTMHIIMVAAILRTEELKGFLDYLFVIVVVIAINIFFFALNLKIYDHAVSIPEIATSGAEMIKMVILNIFTFVKGITGQGI